MKTKLLRLALCAFVAALPIGAWAETDRTTYSTDGETVISETKTWVFNSHTVGTFNTITSPLSDGLYVRANSTNTWTIESAAGSATFSDGTTVSYTQIASSSGANSNQGSNVYSAGYTGAGRFYCTLAINTSVAGTCYAIMSGTKDKHGRVQFADGTAELQSGEGTFGDGNLIEVKYTSTGAGTFFIGGKNGEAGCKVYAVRFVPTEQTISTATSLTFDHFATDANLNSVYNMANGFFIRGNSQKYFTVQDNTDASKPYSFSGGESLQANKYVELNSAIGNHAFSNDKDNDPWTTAGSSTYPSIAFKNTIAGKILVYAAKNTSESTATLRYYTKSTTTTSQNLSVTTTPTEYSWDVAADEVTYITAGNAAGLRIYGVRFVPKTYTLAVNTENGTVTRSPEKDAYDYNEVVTLTATPNDGYKFVDWSTGETTASINVTMTEDKTITANFAKGVTTMAWNFEQYVPGVNMLGDKTANPDYIEYLDGLYLHSRDADSNNHLVATADVTIGTIAGENITSHVKTYKKDCSYTAVVIKSGDNSQAAKSATSPADNKSYNGFAFKAPANGILYYTYYVNAQNAHIYEYKNGGDQKDNSVNYNSGDYTGKGGELSVSLEANDYVCVTTSAANLYILDLSFVPTTADAVTKTVTLKGAGGGYATFSATQNYDLPEGISAYIVTNVNATAATLKQVSEIPACTGVVLYKEGVSTDTDIILTSKETTTVDVSNNMLKANIVDYNLPADDGNGNYNYTLAAGPTFKHSDGTGTLAAGKAFLRTTVNVPSNEARSLELVFDDDETTGIKAIETSQYTNDIYFNLAGQRVEKPTKGLYIVNGKKVVIK